MQESVSLKYEPASQVPPELRKTLVGQMCHDELMRVPLFNAIGTPYTLHPTPYALHHAPYTLHPTP